MQILVQECIPSISGTHDSGSFDIDMKSDPAPDLQQNLKRLVKYTCCVGQKFVVSWSLCQTTPFSEQLQDGIRYFDLRLAYDSKSQDLWLVHGLLSITLRDSLKDIRSFVSKHPGEVVLLDFNHFYAMDRNHHYIASKLVVQFLEEFLYPEPFPLRKLPSVKQCVDSKSTVLVFYRGVLPDMPFWNGFLVRSPWGNKDNTKDLLAFLNANYGKNRSATTLYVTQGILSANTKYIAKNPFSSIRSMADKINPAFIKWLKNKKAGPNGVNICLVDFYQDFEIVPTVIALNK